MEECELETVSMESTGFYWIPLFVVLEERGFRVMLVNSRRVKNEPGRKSDVLDCLATTTAHLCSAFGGLSARGRNPAAEKLPEAAGDAG